MGPTFIYNSETTLNELRQYLALLGLKENLQQMRHNPDSKAIEGHKKNLLNIMLKQARGLGWDLSKDWDPFHGLHTIPKVLAELSIPELLKLIQNQAKLLLKIAPRSECKCGDRVVIVPMTILQNPKGEFYWGVPRLYDWDKKEREKFYVYDAIGKKRWVNTTIKGQGPKSSKQPACYPNSAPLKMVDLRQNFLSAGYGWPVPFLPKSWYDDVHREDDWKHELEKIFDGGFLTVSEPRAVEVIATEDPPSLQDIDESLDLSPEILHNKLPNGEDGPPELEFKDPKNPYEWQKLALDRWINQKNSIELADGSLRTWTGGIIEACTGAGKTQFCFDAIMWVLNQEPMTRISIVVPTEVLLGQWYRELYKKLNEYVEGISRHSSDYDEPAQQISIWVINTASNELPLIDLQQPHLKRYPTHFLIVDEVHRSTSRYFRQIYDFSGSDIKSSDFLHPEYRLGVTATLPSGDSNKVKKYEMLVRHLGPVLCQYKYAHALMKGNISPFQLTFLETGLTSGEADAYLALTEKIRKQHFRAKQLEQKGLLYPEGYEEMTADEKEELGDPFPIKVMQFLGGARARIDWTAANRIACAVDLIRQKVAEGKKILVFHKSIDGATALYNILFLGHNYGSEPVSHLPVGLYHSQNPKGVNEKFLEAFRRHDDEPGPKIKVLVSVQSLLEGLNVPDADVGVAVAADKSQIKAVQSLGRVLRIKPGSEEPKEYFLITVRNEERRGDEIVKAKFISSLLDKRGQFIIPPPETLSCISHPIAEVDKLHEDAQLMSYDQIKHLVDIVIQDDSLLSRSAMLNALVDYGEDIPDDDNDLNGLIYRPEPVWPEWLGVVKPKPKMDLTKKKKKPSRLHRFNPKPRSVEAAARQIIGTIPTTAHYAEGGEGIGATIWMSGFFGMQKQQKKNIGAVRSASPIEIENALVQIRQLSGVQNAWYIAS